MADKSLIILKHLACLSFSLVFIFIALIFVTSSYYQQTINQQIDNTIVLKDFDFKKWGEQPGQDLSQIKLAVTPYNLTIQNGKEIKASPILDRKIEFDYQYRYTNTSFAQGNSGRLSYLNNWELKPTVSRQLNDSNNYETDFKISTVSPGAQTLFYNDYYAPFQRKFVIMYNLLISSLKESFLPNFYSQYLYQYYFGNRNEVINNLFKKLGIDQQKGSQIYDHQAYGWNTPTLLNQWIQLSLSPNPQQLKLYQLTRSHFNLTQKTLSNLIGPRSTLSHMMSALKSSIKYKFWSTYFNYKCQGQLCSDIEIITGQLGTRLLTTQALLGNITLNSTLAGLNSTYFHELEYRTFCQTRLGLNCLGDVSVIPFFSKGYLGNFTIVRFLWQNRQSTKLIEKSMDLQTGTALSIILYMEHLYTKVFNLENKNEQLLKQVFTKYQLLSQSIQNFEQILYTQLQARAIYNKHSVKDKKKCEDYYTGDFKQFAKKVCNDTTAKEKYGFQSLKSIREQVLNYFSPTHRIPFKEFLGMNAEQSYRFFNVPSMSLFAFQVMILKSSLAKHYSCPNPEGCTPKNLLFKQWSNQQILSNLPSEYFGELKQESILNWDFEDRLNGYEPQYSKVIGQKFEAEVAMKALEYNGQKSILNLFNLMKNYKDQQKLQDNQRQVRRQIKRQIRKQVTKVKLQDLKTVEYVDNVVLGCGFGGFIRERSLNQLFKGYEDIQLKIKAQRGVKQGGTPWLSTIASMFPLHNSQIIKYAHQAKTFDQVNTGIYDHSLLRETLAIYGHNTSSSLYTVYEDNQPENTILETMLTNKPAKGTNLYGFHPYIKDDQILKVYLVPFAYAGLTLHKKQNLQWKGINAVKYTVLPTKDQNPQEISIGIEQQNSHSIKIHPDQSTFIIDPTTGLTLEFQILSTTFTSPFYATRFTSAQKVPLFDSNFHFQRNTLQQIASVNDSWKNRKLLELIFQVLGSISMILSVAFSIAYVIRRKRVSKKQSLMESGEDHYMKV